MAAASVASVTSKLERYLGGDESVKPWDLVIHLPSGLDEKLLERALTKLVRSRRGDHGIHVAGRQLNPQYVELFLRLVAKLPSSPLKYAALATPPGTPAERAKRLGALMRMTQQLGVFSMSRSQAAARARTFAKDPDFVAAVQTIVQAARFEPMRRHQYWTLVDVLLNDASPESLDALMPLTARALKKKKGDDFEILRDLVHRVKQPKPSLTPLRDALGPLPPKAR